MPAFLLARFALRGLGRKAQVRCLQHPGGVVESNVLNIGIEKDFHSAIGIFPDAEGMLSEREDEFATELNRWVPGPLDKKGSAIAEELVAQLRLRSREFRELGHLLFTRFVNDGGEVLAESAERARPPLALGDHLASALMATKGTSPPVTEADYRAVVDRAVKGLLADHLNHWVLEGVSAMASSAIASGLPAHLLAGIHTHLIVMQVVNFRRQRTLKGCQWTVLDIPGEQEELVLGDVGPLCVFGEERLSSWRASDLPMRSVYLPFGPRTLLVGSYGAPAPVPMSGRLNDASLALSRNFVVGRHPQSWFEQRTDFRTRATEMSAELTFGIDTPRAAEFVDPAVKAVRDWVDSVVERHWAGRGTPAIRPTVVMPRSVDVGAVTQRCENTGPPTPSG